MCYLLHFPVRIIRQCAIMLMICGGLCLAMPEIKANTHKILDISCNGSIIIEVDYGQCYATVPNISLPAENPTNVSYMLSGVTTSSTNGNTTDASGNEFSIGVTTVTYTYDGGSCSFEVIVLPHINLPTGIQQRDNTLNECFYKVVGDELDPKITTSCNLSGFHFENSLTGTATLADKEILIGDHEINWYFYFGSTLVATEKISVEIIDNQPFTVTPPGNVVEMVDGCSIIKSYPFIISDNCLNTTLTYTLTGDTQKGESTCNCHSIDEEFNAGTTFVSYKLTNNAGRPNEEQFQGSFSVVVVPKFTVPAGPFQFATTAGKCAYVVKGTGFDADISCKNAVSGYSVTNNFNKASLDGVEIPRGTNTITWTSVYNGTVRETHTQSITVIDDQPPVIENCYSNITIKTDQCFATRSFPLDIIENCFPTVTYTLSGATNVANGSGEITNVQFNIGVTHVTYTVTDGTYTTSCSFAVTVLPNIIKPGNTDKSNTTGVCGYTVKGKEFDPKFGCNNLPASFTYTNNINSANTLAQGMLPLGKNDITWTFMLNGIPLPEESFTFTVTVTDDEAPKITCPSFTYPNGEAFFPTDQLLCSAKLKFNAPTVTDNCPGQLTTPTYTITNNGSDIANGSGAINNVNFPTGSNWVTYTVSDGRNTATCSFEVVVRDKSAPVIVPNTCPTFTYPQGKNYFPTDKGVCSKTLNFKAPEAHDNCTPDNELSIEYTITNNGNLVKSGTSDIGEYAFPPGTNIVSYIIKDKGGNSTSCADIIFEVKDDEAPTASCKENYTVTLNASTGTASISALNIDNGSMDNCYLTQLSLDIWQFDCTHVGNVIDVKLTALDNSGNSSHCMSKVTVQYDPDLHPAVIHNKTEMCSDTKTDIQLTSPGFDGITDWSWSANGGTINSAHGNYTIAETLSNTSDVIATVVYTITPTVYSSCALSDITSTILVNPHPKLLAIKDTSICNEDFISIHVRSNSETSSSASIYYGWKVNNNLQIDGDVDGGENAVDMPLTQQLNNRSVAAQKAEYIIRPSLHLNSEVCLSPDDLIHKKQTAIIVEPTPVMHAEVSMDTICNKTAIDFLTNSPNVANGQWLYTLDWDMRSDVRISMLTPPNTQNSQFTDTIHNNAVGRRVVEYKFSPQIIITTDRQHTCHSSKSDTSIFVAVNPTPLMTATIREYQNKRDSICFKDGTEIRLNSDNGNVWGNMEYNLWKVEYNSSDVNNVAHTGVVGFTRTSPGWNAVLDQNQLWNTSDNVQQVTYYLYPVIETHQLHCSGDSIKRDIYIAPELKFEVNLPTFYGGHNISCNGFADGTIKVENTRGGWESAKGYSYSWPGILSADNSTTVVGSLPANNYTVIVSDKIHGCRTQKEMKLTEPRELLMRIDFIPPSCKGPTGQITLHAKGGTKGTKGYQYVWGKPIDSINNDSITDNLRSGPYSVSVMDTNRCVTLVQTVDLPYFSGNLTFDTNWNKSVYGTSVDGTTYNISCHGMKDGSMNPAPNRTVTKYIWKLNGEVIKADSVPLGQSFNWFNNDFLITGLGEGKYSLTIIDDKGCELGQNLDANVDQPTLLAPPPINFIPDISKYENNYEVRCDGTQTGRITISDVTGGYGTRYGPYEYRWTESNGGSGVIQGNATQPNLGAGTYTLTIVNKRNGGLVCDTTTSFTLKAPPPLNITETISDYNGYQIKCYDSSTGRIELNVSGGDGKYIYYWDTGDGSGLTAGAKDQQNLTAGKYTVDILYSGELCVKTKEYTLKAPLPIKSNAVLSTIKCPGDKNASITINPTGGVTHLPNIPTYTYLWKSPNATISSPTSQNQSGLGAGTYELIITDQNSCNEEDTYELTEPKAINANIQAEDLSCDNNGGYNTDGYISTNPTGGTPGYTYLWSTGATAAKITGLPVGTYSVTIKDANNCTSIAQAAVNIPKPLNVTAVAVSDYHGYAIDCYGNHTGKVSANIVNGRSPFTYLWSSGDATAEIEHVKAGLYQVLVVDHFNCKGTSQITLTQPGKMRMQAIPTDVSCPGGNNGSIQAIVGGGVMPYRYSWSIGGQTDAPIASNLTAGEYQISVTDNNECSVDTSLVLAQPSPFQIEFVDIVESFCPEIADGEARAVVSGGTPPYTYSWPGIGAKSPNVSDVKSGSYVLEVTDAYNCKSSATVDIGYASEGCLRIPNAFSPNDDGANDRWEITVGDPRSSVHYQLRDLYPEAVIEVYSANWGILLFRSQKGYPEPWNGKYHGKYLPVNSYFYIIKLNDSIKPITGNVTIIR